MDIDVPLEAGASAPSDPAPSPLTKLALRCDTLQAENIRLRAALKERTKIQHIIHRIRDLYIGGESSETIFEIILESTLAFTQSEYGFIGEVFYDSNDQPWLQTRAITDISWSDQTRALFEQHRRSGLRFDNLDTLFGSALKHKKVIISNTPSTDPRSSGVPRGHPPLTSFLGIPFLIGDELVGMLGLANRPDGYTQSLVHSMTPLSTSCALYIRSIRAEQQQLRLEHEMRQRFQSEILLKEVHHRVKNNMQVICSMLNLQSAKLTHTEQQSIFIDCRDRIRAMSLIHERLYATHRYDRIDFGSYLLEMIPLISASNRRAETDIHLDLDIETIDVDVDRAVTLSLITSELVINALKHAFHGRRRGLLGARLKRHGHHCQLDIFDDGPGAELASGSSAGLGLQLVESLSRQIRGDYALKSTPTGVTATVTWKEDAV